MRNFLRCFSSCFISFCHSHGQNYYVFILFPRMLIFAVDCNLTVYLFCTFLFTLSGSSHFCHWDVQSISWTLTLCPVGFRSLSLSLSHTHTHTHTHIRTHSPTHSTCPQLCHLHVVLNCLSSFIFITSQFLEKGCLWCLGAVSWVGTHGQCS